MDEARLAEIETYVRDVCSIRLSPLFLAEEVVPELIAEVRRLQKLSQQNDQAYSDGESSGHADIVGIITDPDGDPDDDTAVLTQIKRFLGME